MIAKEYRFLSYVQLKYCIQDDVERLTIELKEAYPTIHKHLSFPVFMGMLRDTAKTYYKDFPVSDPKKTYESLTCLRDGDNQMRAIMEMVCETCGLEKDDYTEIIRKSYTLIAMGITDHFKEIFSDIFHYDIGESPRIQYSCKGVA